MTIPIFHSETIAIVEATHELLAERHAAITLRMWHHMHALPQRDTVLIADLGNDRSLIAAFLDAVGKSDEAPDRRAPIGMRREHLPLLEEAFGLALRDVLGKRGTPMVVRAWREVLRAYLADLLRRG